MVPSAGPPAGAVNGAYNGAVSGAVSGAASGAASGAMQGSSQLSKVRIAGIYTARLIRTDPRAETHVDPRGGESTPARRTGGQAGQDGSWRASGEAGSRRAPHVGRGRDLYGGAHAGNCIPAARTENLNHYGDYGLPNGAMEGMAPPGARMWTPGRATVRAHAD